MFETAQPWLSLPIPVRFNGHPHRVLIHVKPADDVSDENDARAVVLFIEGGIVEQTADGQPEPDAGSEIIVRLREELQQTQARLRTMREESESANEELRAANEELQSINEEYRSTSEELETSKEELQSTNEELNTVNDELHARNEELTRVNADLLNLLASVQIAIVIVARDLRIRRFTPMAEKKFNLIPNDIGRPLSQISTTLQCPELATLITETIDTVSPVERTVQDNRGETYLLRIRPYKTPDNRIDGAVIALFDLDPAKK